MGKTHFCSVSFTDLIRQYSKLQSKVLAQLQSLASSISGAAPGKFLLIQFGMSQVTQVGESISNMISQINSLINYAVRSQKAA